MEKKMMLYPKTRRVGSTKVGTEITEKLDGSCLGFFQLEGSLYIAQRNNIFSLETALGSCRKKLYKGLAGFLEDKGEDLENELQFGACIFGEWIGMGRISYGPDFGKFHQFAKCNIDDDLTLKNLYYDRDLFKWSFVSQEQPEYILTVPLVATMETPPAVSELDTMYDLYTAEQQRNVEGFIVNTGNSITKYVRMKNGKLEEHRS